MRRNYMSEEPLKDEIDILDLARILWKNKILISAITIFAAICVLVYALITIRLSPEKSPMPNVFRAVSTVRINNSSSKQSSNLSSILESADLSGIAGIEGFSEAGSSDFIIQLAYSNTTVDIIAEEFDFYKKFQDSKYPKTRARKAVRDGLEVKADEASNTMLISFNSIDRELATNIVNRVVDVLEERHADLDKNSIYSQRSILDSNIQDIEVEIRVLQKQILDFKDRNNILDIESTVGAISGRLATLKTSLIEKESQINTYRDRSRIEDPILKKLEDEKIAIVNSIRALESGHESGIPSMNKLPQLVLEYEELENSLEMKIIVYKTLLQQNEILKLQEAGVGPKFQILEYAEIPEVKAGPSRAKLCISITLLAFFMSIVISFIREFLINLKNDPVRMKKLRG